MQNNNTIPFLDLVGPHQELKEELCCVFKSAVETAGFIGGPVVEKFEADFAQYCGAEHCIGVASGTDALLFALLAAGLKPDTVVITVPNTFIATTEAISQSGCYPDFVDVNEQTYNLDVEKLREYLEVDCYVDVKTGAVINKRLGKPVSAILPVHLYGQTADMDPILDLADQYGLLVIEDACQAHGASYFSTKQKRWRRAGSMGMAAAFSFYPGKNLGACGEGGAVTTNDQHVARTIRMLRDHGQAQKYYHELAGYNGRLDAIQAGILSTKLNHLDRWNEGRRGAAQRYQKLLTAAEVDVVLPHEPDWADSVYHLFVIRVQHRDELQKYFNTVKIGTGIHYPVPLHLQRAYEGLGYKAGSFPVTETIASRLLSLPMFPHITPDQQERVVNHLHLFLDGALKESSNERKYLVAAGGSVIAAD